jgi:hypothetical protein
VCTAPSNAWSLLKLLVEQHIIFHDWYSSRIHHVHFSTKVIHDSPLHFKWCLTAQGYICIAQCFLISHNMVECGLNLWDRFWNRGNYMTLFIPAAELAKHVFTCVFTKSTCIQYIVWILFHHLLTNKFPRITTLGIDLVYLIPRNFETLSYLFNINQY